MMTSLYSPVPSWNRFQSQLATRLVLSNTSVCFKTETSIFYLLQSNERATNKNPEEFWASGFLVKFDFQKLQVKRHGDREHH